MKKRPHRSNHLTAVLATSVLFGCRSDEPNAPPIQTGGANPTTTAPGSGSGSSPGSDTGALSTSGDTDTPLECAGHRLYQCAGFKIGVYDDKTTPVAENDWSPGGAGIAPLMCFPGAGFVRQGNDNLGFGGHDHQQDPLLVCAPEVEGNANDPTSQLGIALRELCMEACNARPIDTVAIPDFLTEWTGITGENWGRRFEVCDVGPGVDSIVDSEYGGNGVLCVSILGSPPAHPGAADVGACSSADEFSDCPIDDLELCQDWHPERWIFSTTDRVGNIKSVIHDDFLADGVTLSTMFACDEHAYVYSGDGTGVATIDVPAPNDFLERLWLREGYNDFTLRAETSVGWSNRYPLNTFQEITDAVENLPGTSQRYELVYNHTAGNRITRTIEVADCTARGDSQACDPADL